MQRIRGMDDATNIVTGEFSSHPSILTGKDRGALLTGTRAFTLTLLSLCSIVNRSLGCGIGSG